MILVATDTLILLMASVIAFSIGILVGVTKGSRNQSQEIIENLHVLQHAKRHSVDPTMNMTFASFLTTTLTHSKVGNLDGKKRLELKHPCKKEDSGVRLLFPNEQLQFFKVLHLGNCRLCTRCYSHGKRSDDSNILFWFNGNEQFGRIRAIFCVNGDTPLLYVAYCQKEVPMICSIDTSNNVEFSGIQSSTTTQWSYTLTDIDNFIEKTIFFESPDRKTTFSRFPNLNHSS